MVPRRVASLLLASLLLSWLVPSLVATQTLDSARYADLRWRMIGPYRGGRTVAAVGVPGQSGLFYIGVNDGGVWKTTDYGRTWRPIFDQQPTGSIGAIAIAPSDSNTIYVGSGEGLQRPDLSVGDGMYKSVDGGRNWTHLGLRDGQQIGAIIIDPRDANRVLVAVIGHPYGPNPERGIFRSTDGGQSWDKVLYKDENTGAIDLAFDPGNPSIIYGVLWAARQAPWEVGDSWKGPGSGLYKSTDGGSSWRPLTSGLPSLADGLGRIGVAVAPSDPTRLYANVDAGALGGVYRSDDAGESWRRVNSEERVWGRGGDFAEVRVDPRNPDIVYSANTSTYRSTDGGQHFVAIKGAPGGDDYHRIWIDPGNPRIILIGSDQGATISVNGGETWSSWFNQPSAQMFHVTADNRFPYWLYGGQQESGSAGVVSRGNDGQITFRDWHTVGVEEYGYAAPDPLHPGIIFGGKATRYDERTGDVQNVGPVVLRTPRYRSVRTMPILFSPFDPHVLYLGANVLFKTTDYGHSWRQISPDLSRKTWDVPSSVGIFADRTPAARQRGVIYAVAPSPRRGALIWAGTDDGLIHLTRDGGAHWANVTPPELTPWSKVSILDASHFDTVTAYAAINRFRLDDLHPYIYRTHDGGAHWQLIVTGIADNEVVNVVREDPARRGLLFAGTERGVYLSIDDGDHWQSLRLNMPPTSVRDLIIHDDDVAVATHGRGFWILDDMTLLRQLATAPASAEVQLFRPRRTVRIQRHRGTDTPLPPEEPAGKNPPDGALIDYYLPAASPEVALEIRDARGALVRRFSSRDTLEMPDSTLDKPTYWMRPPITLSTASGHHRFVWDLHYPPPDALEWDYPISATVGATPRVPQGPLIAPGRYAVRLTAGDATRTQPLNVVMDPRASASAAELAQQLALSQQVTDAMHRGRLALDEVRKTRVSLAPLVARSGSSVPLRQALHAMDSVTTALDTGGDGERSPGLTRINAECVTLLEALQGTDRAPTTQLVATVADERRRLQAQLTAWEEVKRQQRPALDVLLRREGLPPIGAP